MLLRLLQTSIVREILKQKDIRKMTEEYFDWRLVIFGILLVVSFFIARSSWEQEKSDSTPSEKTKYEPSLSTVIEKDVEAAQLARPSSISFSENMT